MSIRLMTKVWDSGQYDSGTLLVLLALCDWANDEGEKLFPGLEKLATKARLSTKQTRRALETLMTDGVVIDLGCTGITKTRPLDLKLNLDSAPFRDKMSPGHSSPSEGKICPDAGSKLPASGTNVPPHIDNHQAIHQENHHEPPSTAVTVVAVPSELDLAVQAFNAAAESCPKWTRCRDLTDPRRKAIQARLDRFGLRGWLAAVERAAASAHLGGPVPTTGTHQGWRMDIGWFAKAENFTRIAEGAYAPGRHERPKGLDSIAAGISAFLAGAAGETAAE